MTHLELRAARERLGLTQVEMARMLDMDSEKSVIRMESDPTLKTARPAPRRAVRLIEAYLAGYRPTDWPKREGTNG